MGFAGNGSVLYTRPVRCQSAADKTGSHLENFYLDKKTHQSLVNLDSSLIKIIMRSNFLPTYRDSSVYQILCDVSGLPRRSLHMIIHGFVFEIYKTGL